MERNPSTVVVEMSCGGEEDDFPATLKLKLVAVDGMAQL